ncbi:uncharacterized protein DFL_009444 [Arthrobotrys flagrans]|uniref:Uncharacterized protein n=1 Tax=Arthrobotrys flagrans TaxID=97331 RepID=A0A436ZRN9_ARTFL|nr:hypothetical protein DFL_009444 [Arthrobotrys flagrans]
MHNFSPFNGAFYFVSYCLNPCQRYPIVSACLHIAILDRFRCSHAYKPIYTVDVALIEFPFRAQPESDPPPLSDLSAPGRGLKERQSKGQENHPTSSVVITPKSPNTLISPFSFSLKIAFCFGGVYILESVTADRD